MTKEKDVNPFELMQETAQALAQENTKKPWAGWKAKLVFNSPDFTATLDIRHGKAKVEPILELEGEMVKVDNDGNILTTHEVDHYFKNVGGKEVEVSAAQVRKMQRLEDGTLEPAADLPKTDTISIKEGRAKDECVLDENNPKMALGTTIPRSDVDRFAPESTYEYWDYAAALLRLAEYLEKEKLALYFPFSHGKG